MSRKPSTTEPRNETQWYETAPSVLRRYLAYVTRLTTEEPLSPTQVMRELIALLDCDVLVLVSRTVDDGTGLRVQRLARQATAGGCWDDLFREKAFQKIIYNVIAQSRKAHIPSHFVDWQPTWLWDSHEKYRSTYESARIPQCTLEDEARLRMEYPWLGLIFIGQLGYLQIGDWRLGESLLIAGNEFTEEDRDLGGVRPISRVDFGSAFQAFCIFLSEVNANFWRKKDVDSRPLSERRNLLSDTDLQQDYVRSACRLAPLIGKDLAVTIETLVQIEQLIQKARDRSQSAASKPFTLRKAKKSLLSCYACRKDEFDPPQPAESSRRQRLVKSAWKWSQILRDARHANGNREGYR